MRMKKNLLKLLLISGLLFAFAPGSLYAQVEGEEENEEHVDGEDLEEHEDDSSFEDYLATIGYYFDSTLIPAQNLYPLWDTKRIHVYDQDINQIDTTMVVLRDTMDCFFHPPCFGYITSNFGYRTMRRRRKGRMHYGTDVKLYTGDPVYSIFDGVVRIAQYSKSYGYVVVVRHYNGLETIYAHFSKLLTKPGMILRAGDPIGLGGNTGRSYGSHLHFEIRFKGIPFDATRIIDFENGTLYQDTIYIDKSFFPHLTTKNYKKKATTKKGTKTPKKATPTNGKAKYHTVKSGDTLGGIAVKYGTTITKICSLNGISRNKTLRVGQKLRVK